MAKLLIGIYVILTSSALIALKLGAEHAAPLSYAQNKLSLNLNPYVVGGIVLYGSSFILYTYLISKYDLGYIIPLTTGLVYILIFFASYSIFHEAFGALKIVAILLILAGIALLNIAK